MVKDEYQMVIKGQESETVLPHYTAGSFGRQKARDMMESYSKQLASSRWRGAWETAHIPLFRTGSKVGDSLVIIVVSQDLSAEIQLPNAARLKVLVQEHEGKEKQNPKWMLYLLVGVKDGIKNV